MSTESYPDRRKRSLGLLLFTTPYSSEYTDTAVKLAKAALAKGYEATIFAYGDSVHNFTVGQRAKGITNAEAEFQPLIAEKGLKVELCGTCLAFRGITDGSIMKGAVPSSMKNLCTLIDRCDKFVSLT